MRLTDHKIVGSNPDGDAISQRFLANCSLLIARSPITSFDAETDLKPHLDLEMTAVGWNVIVSLSHNSFSVDDDNNDDNDGHDEDNKY